MVGHVLVALHILHDLEQNSQKLLGFLIVLGFVEQVALGAFVHLLEIVQGFKRASWQLLTGYRASTVDATYFRIA